MNTSLFSSIVLGCRHQSKRRISKSEHIKLKMSLHRVIAQAVIKKTCFFLLFGWTDPLIACRIILDHLWWPLRLVYMVIWTASIWAQKCCCWGEEAMTLQPIMLMALLQHGCISHITTGDHSPAPITQYSCQTLKKGSEDGAEREAGRHLNARTWIGYHDILLMFS